MNALPDKPSELIRLALSDLEKCEKDERYRIDMYSWHEPFDGVCNVCLAGSILAMSVGVPPPVTSFGNDHGDDVHIKTNALNDFRLGYVQVGLSRLKIKACAVQEKWRVVNYHDDPTHFKNDMNAMADMLEEYGL